MSRSDAFAGYWAAVAAGDAAAAVDIAVAEAEDGVPLEDVLDELVCAAQSEVGRLWAANEWNIAKEHRATSIGEEVLLALTSRIRTPPGGRTALITCADGEWHSLPSRVLSAVMRSSGWRVTFLGASVPAQHLSQLLHEIGPDVVAISCALPTRLFEARQMIEVSRGAGVPVLVGGRGFGADGSWARRLGATAWAPDARGALAALAQLPAFTTPAPPIGVPDPAITLLRKRQDEVVARSMAQMLARVPDVARYDERQQQRTREDVGYIVDFLRASLYVEDARLFVDFVGWLRDILVARGVREASLRGGLRTVGAVIEAEPGPYDRALEHLEAGIAALG